MGGTHGSGDVGRRTPLASGELASGTDSRPADRSRRPLARNLVVGVLGLAAAAVFLASGVVLLLFVALIPYHDTDAALLVALKTADVIGWLAIGLWLLVDWWHLRLRVLVPPLAAWIWMYVISTVSYGIGYVNWGP